MIILLTMILNPTNQPKREVTKIKEKDIAYTIVLMLLKELPDTKRNMKTIDQILSRVKDVLNEVPLDRTIL